MDENYMKAVSSKNLSVNKIFQGMTTMIVTGAGSWLWSGWERGDRLLHKERNRKSSSEPGCHHRGDHSDFLACQQEKVSFKTNSCFYVLLLSAADTHWSELVLFPRRRLFQFLAAFMFSIAGIMWSPDIIHLDWKLAIFQAKTSETVFLHFRRSKTWIAFNLDLMRSPLVKYQFWEISLVQLSETETEITNLNINGRKPILD